MDVHELGIDIVVWLQQNLNSFQTFFLWFSNFGDPRNAFLLIFPICYALNRNTGISCLWIASLTEWINAILKWYFQDDRPYWYAKSKAKYAEYKIEQFPITCETGPGFPSGHVMSMSAVGLHVILSMNIFIGKCKNLKNWMKTLMKHTLIALFLTVVTLVAVSRVYIATHFPHQVAVAVVMGIFIAYVVGKVNKNIDLSESELCIILSAFLLIGAYLFHEGLVLMNHNPSVTVSLAKKWCLKNEWVHLDTTPFYAVTRDSAVIFGLGLAFKFLNKNKNFTDANDSSVSKLLQIFMNLLFCFWLESCKTPQESYFVFYILAFLKFTAVPLVVVCVTPITISYIHKIFICDFKYKVK